MTRASRVEREHEPAGLIRPTDPGKTSPLPPSPTGSFEHHAPTPDALRGKILSVNDREVKQDPCR
jgi:hypothetical protein